MNVTGFGTFRQVVAAGSFEGVTSFGLGVSYKLPFRVTSAKSAAKLAATLEEGGTRAYLGLVAVSNPALRTYAARAMQTSANRALAWSGTTTAFPGMPA